MDSKDDSNDDDSNCHGTLKRNVRRLISHTTLDEFIRDIEDASGFWIIVDKDYKKERAYQRGSKAGQREHQQQSYQQSMHQSRQERNQAIPLPSKGNQAGLALTAETLFHRVNILHHRPT